LQKTKMPCGPIAHSQRRFAHAGVPEAKRAAAEALTNMASMTYLPSADATSAAGSSSTGDKDAVNVKVDVQRAGAATPLVAMLKLADERCIQAAATALYVLAASDENRAAMQGSGVRQALQEVLAKAKRRPPAIGERTRRDCEEAIARMLA
jgi:hypothetical protein